MSSTKRVLLLFALLVACNAPREKAAADAKPWYHESDVAQLSATGRPQLVEFFHPN